MTSPFTTYNSNQRVVAIPITPTLHNIVNETTGGTFQIGLITLTGTNAATAALVTLYVHYLFMNPRTTPAVSGLSATFGFQFQNAGHAAVGGFTAFHTGSCGAGAAATCALYPMEPYEPSFPGHYSLAIPATAVEVALQVIIFGVTGAPSVDITAGWSADTLNAGATSGDIGGGGMTAQSATNPNTF